MARLGISVYPEHSTIEKDQAYIRKAGSLGYKRIFTCLLSVGDKSREEVVNEFRALADTAHECGMEIIPDVSPAVFSRLGISYDDLSVFQEMHVELLCIWRIVVMLFLCVLVVVIVLHFVCMLVILKNQ